MTEELINKKLARRLWKKIIFIAVVIALIVMIAPPVLNRMAENKIKEKLALLAPWVTVHFSSLHANLFASSLSIDHLSIKFQPDSSNPHYHSFYFSELDFTGINFLNILMSKALLINQLKLDKGSVQLDEFLINKEDSTAYGLLTRIPFKYIAINHLEISKTDVYTQSTQENKLLLSGEMNIDNIKIGNTTQSSSVNTVPFDDVQCNIINVNYSIPSQHRSLQIKHLLLDSKRKILRIDSVRSTPDTADNSANPTEVFISSIDISEFDVLKLKDKQLVAGTILINKSDGHIFNAIQKNSKEVKLPAFNFNQIVSDLKIDSLIIANSSLNFESAFEKNSDLNKEALVLKHFSVNHFLVEETNITMHSENHLKIRKIEITNLNKSLDSSFRYSSVAFNVSNIRYCIPHVYRTVQIKNVIGDSKHKLLKVEGLKISTQYSKYEFGKKLGRQADYIDATVPRIEISGLDFKQLPLLRLVADKITVDECKLYFFRDRRLPRQLKEQPMPNGYLNQIPIEVRVNTLRLNNASILSEEFPKLGDQAGYLAIDKVNISMSPMLNHPTKNDPVYSNTYVEGSIMNAGLIQANIHAPLRKNIYFITGVIKDLNLPKLNPSAENLGRFHIESGVLNFLDFHFTATEEKATGEIIGEYHDLLIDRLKPKGDEKEVAKVPTFLLKHVIIRKNKDASLNVKKRTGEIDYKRDPTRIVTFYFLKSLLSGIRASFTLGFLLPE